MDDTPTPRTDKVLSDTGYFASIFDLITHARELERELTKSQSWVRASMESAAIAASTIARLERELNEARLRYDVLLLNYNADTISLVASERDQLRKVCDELAGTIYVHSLRPQNALDGYKQLPHVLERKTK